MATSSLCGCSLFVMAGKSLFGDPVVESPFSRAAHVDLTDGTHKVVIVASTPETIKAEFPATNSDLIEKVSRNLRSKGVQVVNPNKVATWLDDNGGYWEDINQLAKDFDCDYIIHLEVERLSLQEPNTPTCFKDTSRDRSTVTKCENERRQSVRIASSTNPFDRKYPDGYPKMGDRLTRDSFYRELMEHLGTALSQVIANYRTNDQIF